MLAAAPSVQLRVAGVSFEGRQEAVAALGAGDSLLLEREPLNPHDANAVHVATLAPAKGRPPTRFEGHLEGVTCCALDAAGRTLFSGSGDGQVLLWTAASLPADDDAAHAFENCDAWSEDSADDLLAQYDV